jgi:ADP-heptose:LPS heptosyltransferase
MREWVRGRFVASVVARARATTPRDRSEHRPLRVVLLRPDHLGDVLLTTPAIAALREALPTAHIDALVGPWAAGVLAGNTRLDTVRTLASPGFDRTSAALPWQPYRLLARAARELRALRYDVGVNARPDFWWGATLLARAAIPVRVGFDCAPGHRALTHSVPAPDAHEHAAHASLRLVRAVADIVGARASHLERWDYANAPLELTITAQDRAWAAQWLAERGLQRGRFLAAHPGSGAAVKLWRPELWARALAAIAREHDVAVVVSGTAAERALVAEVMGALPQGTPAQAYLSEETVGRFAAVLSCARLVVGVDSGPLHLAVAAGAPTVRLYGPSSAQIFGPWGPPERHAVVASDLPCAPCGRLDYGLRELAWHPCVRLLTPGAVVAAARRVLGATGADTSGASAG